MAMAEAQRDRVILSAIEYVNSLGTNDEGLVPFPGYAKPISRKAAMNRTVRDIVSELSDGSDSARLIQSLTGEATKHFAGTLLSVQKEQSSSRAVLTLDTGTERECKDFKTKQPLPAGQEQVRTDPAYYDTGMILIMEARSLIDHRVLVTMEIEQMRNDPNKKVRTVRNITDLGKPLDRA